MKYATVAVSALLVVVLCVSMTTSVYGRAYRGSSVEELARQVRKLDREAEIVSLEREVAGVMGELEEEERAVMQEACSPGSELDDGSLQALGESIYGDGGQSYAYVTPDSEDCAGRLFVSGDCSDGGGSRCSHGRITANRHDSEMQLLDLCPGVDTYWSGWSPCISCIEDLINREHRVSTMYIGQIYMDSRRGRVEGSKYGEYTRMTYCLAWLVKVEGINLLPWDWTDFVNQHVTHTNGKLSAMSGECVGIIGASNRPTGIKGMPHFAEINRETAKVIGDADRLAHNTEADVLRNTCTN